MEARGLNLPGKGAGDAVPVIPGLCVPEPLNWKGKPGIWLLEAEDVGIGGEKGRGG